MDMDYEFVDESGEDLDIEQDVDDLVTDAIVYNNVFNKGKELAFPKAKFPTKESLVQGKERLNDLIKSVLTLGVDYEVARFKEKQSYKYGLVMTRLGVELLARAFGITYYPIWEQKTKESDKNGEIQHYIWRIRVKATAPNGQFAIRTGSFSSKEDFEPNESHIIAKAETRAVKKSVIALTGAIHWNHLTAEEKEKHIQYYNDNHTNNNTAPNKKKPKIQAKTVSKSTEIIFDQD